MKSREEKALDRALKALERPPRRRGGLSLAPWYFGLALLLAYQLLVRFVPKVWAATLPNGLAQAETLRGWPGLVWALSRLCAARFSQITLILVGAAALVLIISSLLRPLRLLVWLLAIAAIACDIAILVITMQAALQASMREAGLGM